MERKKLSKPAALGCFRLVTPGRVRCVEVAYNDHLFSVFAQMCEKMSELMLPRIRCAVDVKHKQAATGARARDQFEKYVRYG